MGPGGKTDIRSFGLTDKEGDLIALVAEGLSNKEIAERLFLSEGTVRNSLSVVLEKLNLRGRTQLAIFYYKNIAPA
jgi:DNA-binding NarL/FixJ family response regulator